MNIERLLAHIEALAQYGGGEDGGVSRLAFTAIEQKANDYIIQLMQNAGMDVKIDAIGNIIGTYTATVSDKTLAPLVTGSHIDTVPNGGKYDGALGVLAAIEAVQSIAEQQLELARPLQVVSFKDEEGARFGVGLLGSKAASGNFDSQVLEQTDAEHVSIRQAMLSQGLQPDRLSEAEMAPPHAYIELHIEQGRVLEMEDLPVGIVTGIAGPLWFEVTLQGMAEHAGATPMHLRKDALVCASKIIVEIEKIAARFEGSVATVGKLQIAHAGINVIPGTVSFTCDLRHVDENVRNLVEEAIQKVIAATCAQMDIQYDVKLLQRVKPVLADQQLIAHIAQTIEQKGLRAFQLSSGAGHDAMLMASKCPVAMIFVRNKLGISHNPLEYVSSQDIEIAAEVLQNTLIRIASTS